MVYADLNNVLRLRVHDRLRGCSSSKGVAGSFLKSRPRCPFRNDYELGCGELVRDSDPNNPGPVLAEKLRRAVEGPKPTLRDVATGRIGRWMGQGQTLSTPADNRWPLIGAKGRCASTSDMRTCEGRPLWGRRAATPLTPVQAECRPTGALLKSPRSHPGNKFGAMIHGSALGEP